MTITTPIYLVKIEGNLKYITSDLPDVITTNYEEITNKTYVVVKATNENLTKGIIKYFYNIHENLEKHRRTYKKEQVEVEYLKDGIDL
jgi:hypothetical protein